jgi:tripartite-type tricarboxylate transporter receptor subunit TctC
MHLSAALFGQMADVKLVEVPYKGSGPAALDMWPMRSSAPAPWG